MAAMQTFDFLQLCPHLKSEWAPLPSDKGYLYQHHYSSDLSQVKYLTAISMRELDIYSSREAYTFPHTPRLYKYVIEKNRHRANQLIFDLVVLVQRVPQRLTSLNPNDTITVAKLANWTKDIVLGFDYLFRRHGPFPITGDLIGWTETGVRTWLNSDLSVNRKLQGQEREETMVFQLITLLQQKHVLPPSFKIPSSFKQLLLQVEATHAMQKCSSKISFKPYQSQNVSNSNKRAFQKQRSNSRLEQMNQDRSISKSSKNVPFSYSNKDVSTKSVANSNNGRTTVFKRSSIQMDPTKALPIPADFRLSAECCNSPITSFKLIVPDERRISHKKSFFKREKEESQVESPPQNRTIGLKTLEEHFSKTTKSSMKENEQKKEFKPVAQTLDQMSTLHYSTSSNPVKKFFPKRTQGKTYSTNGHKYLNIEDECTDPSICSKNNSVLSEENYQLCIRRDEILKAEEQRREEESQEHGIKTFQIDEEENMRQSQDAPRESHDIQKDLQALFNSDHSFDYNELENELDCIL